MTLLDLFKEVINSYCNEVLEQIDEFCVYG